MTSRDFCYWLQGLYELGKPVTLDADQTAAVKAHLALVFKHEIDPSAGGPDVQAALNKIHEGAKPPQTDPGAQEFGGHGTGGLVWCMHKIDRRKCWTCAPKGTQFPAPPPSSDMASGDDPPCQCNPADRTGGGHDPKCPDFEVECTCYEMTGGHQPMCPAAPRRPAQPDPVAG